MIEWHVYRENDEVEIDTVWFQSALNESDILDSLINHDNYPSDITIKRAL